MNDFIIGSIVLASIVALLLQGALIIRTSKQLTASFTEVNKPEPQPELMVEYNVAEGTIQTYPLYGVAACNAKAIWDARTFFRFNSGTWYQLSTGLPAGDSESESLTAAYISMKGQLEAERVKSLLVSL